MDKSFKRGDIYYAYVPPVEHSNESPPPSYIIQGRRMFVLLHDYHSPDVPSKSVLAAPITRAKSMDQKLLPDSFVQLSKKDYPCLKYDSYIATHQVMPLSRHWLAEVASGRLTYDDQFMLDLQLLKSMGLQKTVQGLIQRTIEEKFKDLFGHQREAAAGSKEINRDRNRDLSR